MHFPCLRHFQGIHLSLLLKYKIESLLNILGKIIYQLFQLRNSELEIILKFWLLNKYIPADVKITWVFLFLLQHLT